MRSTITILALLLLGCEKGERAVVSVKLGGSRFHLALSGLLRKMSSALSMPSPEPCLGGHQVYKDHAPLYTWLAR